MRKDIIKNMLVISMQGMGDLLLFTPAFSCLRKNYPDAKISVLIMDKAKDIVKGNPDIDEIIEYDYSERRNLFKTIRFMLLLRKKRFDVSICAYPSGLRSALVGYFSGAKIRIGQKLSFTRKLPFLFTNNVPVTEIKHAVEMNLDLLGAIGLDIARCPRKLFTPVSGDDAEFAKEFFANNGVKEKELVIAVHPGVSEGGIHRSWSKANFAELIDDLLNKYNAKVILIGGPADKSALEEIYAATGRKPIILKGVPINRMAAILKISTLFIGNNSGPMHIAASVGTPTVAMFGDTDPKIHAPHGNKSVILRKDLRCSPCHYPFLHGVVEGAKPGRGFVRGRFVCSEGDFKCMKLITVSDVLTAVEALLKDIGNGHS